MSHRARGGFYGEFGGDNSQLDSRYNFWLRKIDSLDAHTVKRTKGKTTLKSYQAMYENEYWCSGEECVKHGFADEVANVSCDDSLLGTNAEIDRFMWMGRNIELKVIRSRCPLITGVIDVKVKVDGKDFKKGLQNDDWRNSASAAASRAETQRLYNFIQTRVSKKTLPERVIYMEVPSAGSAISPTMQVTK